MGKATDEAIFRFFSVRRIFTILLILYLCVNVLYASKKTILVDSDGASRGLFALMLKDITKDIMLNGGFKWQRALGIMRCYNSHYFVGLEPIFLWTPLQVVYLYLVSFMDMNYEVVFALSNLLFLALSLIYIYKLTKVIFENKIISYFACAIFMAHPLVFDTAISLRRGLGETCFLLMAAYHFLLFLKSLKPVHFLNSVIIAFLGLLYRETAIISMLAICVFSLPPLIKNNGFRKTLNGILLHKAKVATAVILGTVIFLYILIQIPLTQKGVSTLFTKGERYVSWGAKNIDINGFAEMSDYFSAMPILLLSRFDRNYAEQIKKTNPVLYNKALLIEFRFSIPLYKKFFFIVSTVFCQWYIFPFFIIGLLSLNKLSNIGYGIWYIPSLIVLYSIMLSLTGTIPDFNMPLIGTSSILSAAGLFMPGEMVARPFKKVAAIFIFVAVFLHASHILQDLLTNQHSSPAPGLVIKKILGDNHALRSYTVLMDSQAAPIYGLKLAQIDADKRIYLLPVSTETVTKEKFLKYISRGGFERSSNFFGDIKYPQTENILAFSPAQFDYYKSIFAPTEMPFYPADVITQKGVGAQAYIYNRVTGR